MFFRFFIAFMLICAGISLPALSQYASRTMPQGEVPYRLAGFQFPKHPRALAYRLEIALGHWAEVDSFQKYRIKDTILKTNQLREILPYFDQDYTWTYTPLGRKGKSLDRSPFVTFRTGYHPIIDSQFQKLQVIVHDTLDPDLYIFADEIGVLYDLKGNPLWYLPDWPADSGWGSRSLRDLKPSPLGTLTGINPEGAYELNYQGQILWRAPALDSQWGHKSRYHHQMDRLPNGHYMILGEEIAWIRLEDTTDSWKDASVPLNPETERREDGLYQRFLCGTLIEYDGQGNLQWFWSSADLFRNEIHPYNARVGGMVPAAHAHLNGFYLDSISQSLLLSFRDLSQIYQVSYPSGELFRVFGHRTQVVRRPSARIRVKSPPLNSEASFQAQHHPYLLGPQMMSVFNNQGGGVPSEVRIFEIPRNKNEALRLMWSFPGNLDTLAPPLSRRGGSAYALPDQSLLVCMGNAGRIFIVDAQKNIRWNAIPYSRTDRESPWRITPLYRSSYLYGAKAIDALIFGPSPKPGN